MLKDKAGNAIIRNPGDFREYVNERKQVAERKLFTLDKTGTVQVDHVATANALIKLIRFAPIDKVIKQIMIMRIGNPLMHGKQMSHISIAIALGMTIEEVIELEKIGVKLVNEFMERRMTLTDAIKASTGSNEQDSLAEGTLNNMVNPREGPPKGAA